MDDRKAQAAYHPFTPPAPLMREEPDPWDEDFNDPPVDPADDDVVYETRRDHHLEDNQ